MTIRVEELFHMITHTCQGQIIYFLPKLTPHNYVQVLRQKVGWLLLARDVNYFDAIHPSYIVIFPRNNMILGVMSTFLELLPGASSPFALLLVALILSSKITFG